MACKCVAIQALLCVSVAAYGISAAMAACNGLHHCRQGIKCQLGGNDGIATAVIYECIFIITCCAVRITCYYDRLPEAHHKGLCVEGMGLNSQLGGNNGVA